MAPPSQSSVPEIEIVAVPVTVPLVLALGIGVCRIVGDADSSNAGFGIVTLASLLPVLAVLALGFFHFAADDYYGREHYAGEVRVESAAPAAAPASGGTDRRRHRTMVSGHPGRSAPPRVG